MFPGAVFFWKLRKIVTEGKQWQRGEAFHNKGNQLSLTLIVSSHSYEIRCKQKIVLSTIPRYILVSISKSNMEQADFNSAPGKEKFPVSLSLVSLLVIDQRKPVNGHWRTFYSDNTNKSIIHCSQILFSFFLWLLHMTLSTNLSLKDFNSTMRTRTSFQWYRNPMRYIYRKYTWSFLGNPKSNLEWPICLHFLA